MVGDLYYLLMASLAYTSPCMGVINRLIGCYASGNLYFVLFLLGSMMSMRFVNINSCQLPKFRSPQRYFFFFCCFVWLLSLFLWVSFFVIFPCFTSELLMFFFFSNYSQNPWILPSWDTHQNWPVFCLCHWPYFSGVISGHPKDLQCWFWSTHGSLVLFQVNPLFVYHDTDLWSLFFVVISCVVFLLHTSWSIFL